MYGIYETFRRPYNKHKHGHPFLFSMGTTPQAAPTPFSRLSPAVPYFADESNLEIVEPVFIGEVVLDKIHTLIEGGGGVSSLLRDFTDNVIIRCKYGGRKIIARTGYGPSVLTADEVSRFTQLISDFDKRFATGPSPKKHKLNVKSDFKRSDWDYFDQDWTMK